jgi:hypothetical protein
MGVHPWRRLVCACMPVSSRSTTPSSGGPEKKEYRQPVSAVAPPAHQRVAGDRGVLAGAFARLLLRRTCAKALLANPDQDTGQGVRERYLAHLARMRDELASLGQLAEAFEHFCHLTDNFAAGFFRCYDIAGLPRTNNDLEHCFGVARVHERRATGRRGAEPFVVVRGSVRVMAAVTSKQQVFSVEELRPKDYQRWRDALATITPAGGSAQTAMALS